MYRKHLLNKMLRAMLNVLIKIKQGMAIKSGRIKEKTKEAMKLFYKAVIMKSRSGKVVFEHYDRLVSP